MKRHFHDLIELQCQTVFHRFIDTEQQITLTVLLRINIVKLMVQPNQKRMNHKAV